MRGKTRRGEADQGHRLRAAGPAAGRLLLPPHGPRPGRLEASHAPLGVVCSRHSSRLRVHLPRLPAEHLAGVRERLRGSRRAAGAADPGHAVFAHIRPARAGGRRTARRCSAFFSMVDGRKGLHREVRERMTAEHAEVLRTAVPASADVERMGPRRTVLEEFAPRDARRRPTGSYGGRFASGSNLARRRHNALAMADVPRRGSRGGDGRCPARTGDLLLVRPSSCCGLLPFAAQASQRVARRPSLLRSAAVRRFHSACHARSCSHATALVTLLTAYHCRVGMESDTPTRHRVP